VSNRSKGLEGNLVPADAELIRGLQEGREDAFREMVGRYQHEVYRLARGMVRDHDEADEVAQRTFIQVYRKISAFEGRSSLRTWIFRIAVNQAKNLLRQGGRRGEMPEEDRLPDPAPNADERIDGARRWARVVRAVTTLPRVQRAVLTLRVDQGLSYEEIGGIVGCSAGSAKVNYHHAVKKLRGMLSGESEE